MCNHFHLIVVIALQTLGIEGIHGNDISLLSYSDISNLTDSTVNISSNLYNIASINYLNKT